MNKNVLMMHGWMIAGSIFLMNCKGPAAGPPPGGPVPVTIMQVKQQAVSYFDAYPANVVALNQVELRAQVTGYVSGIFFTEGQSVKTGQKLYSIEQTRYAAAYQQAQAALGVAQSNLQRAKNDAERYEQLGKQDAVARQRVEYALTDYQNAKQQHAAAEAQVANARNDLHHSTIYAPFDGTIGISLVKSGTFVTAGQTVLNTVSSDDPMSVDFVIGEKEIPRFMKLYQEMPTSRDTLFTLGFADRSVYPYPGKIQFFDRAVDPQTGTFKIRLQFPNPQRMLRAGMSCEVRVMNKSGNNSMVVPFKAVTEQMGEYFVYVVENDTARQHKVSLGPTVKNEVVVFTGLNPGDKIVTEGIQKLKDGSPVTEGHPQGAQGTGATPQPANKSATPQGIK